MARTRSPAKNPAAKPVYMVAKYSGNCRCGNRISMGDSMCYDRVTRQSLCMSCAKGRDTGSISKSTRIEPVSEFQNVLDRLTQLTAAPTPHTDMVQDEIGELTRRIEQIARTDMSARRNLLKQRVRDPMIVITARYAGKCAACKETQEPGGPVAYDRRDSKIYCYNCAPVVDTDIDQADSGGFMYDDDPCDTGSFMAIEE